MKKTGKGAMESYMEKKARLINCLVAAVVAIIINYDSSMGPVILFLALGYAAYLKLN